MCRISGIIDFKASSDYDLYRIGQNMRDRMAYGGPDDAGEFFHNEADARIYLGHRRLSVIDTSTGGHQPMYYKDLVIVFNGEIYNYAEISDDLKKQGYQFNSHSDTEVILKAFDLWGYDAVQRFRGMFAFALWNTKTRKLLLCRDRVGVKPLYWYYIDNVFLFGSELKSMREFPHFDTAIDQEAVSLFLQTGYIKAPYSIYKNARKIAPGAFLEIDENGGIRTWNYWNVKNISLSDSYDNDKAVLEEAEKLLTESAQYRMVADVPVGIFLSGGIDSSLVTALLQKKSGSSLKTFTIGFDDKRFDESTHAKNVAAFLGTDHYELICTQDDFKRVIPLLPDIYDEPFGDSSAIPTYLVSAMARKQVTVALSADGGDEVFSGYLKYKSVSEHYNKIRYLPLAIREKIAGGLGKIDLKKLENRASSLGIKYDFKGLEWRLPKFRNALSARDKLHFFELASSYISHSDLEKLHHLPVKRIFEGPLAPGKENYLYATLGKIDIDTYLEGDILTKVDRASMAVALEGREPLLDHKLIEFGLSLPDKYKIRNGQTKWILRNILYKHVPKELIERPKQGFAIPVNDWLQSELKEYLIGLSNDGLFCETFQLHKEELSNVINDFLDPYKPSANPLFIWFLYSLYMWYKKWV